MVETLANAIQPEKSIKGQIIRKKQVVLSLLTNREIDIGVCTYIYLLALFAENV